MHPSIRSIYVFVKMRNMNDESLRLRAGFSRTAPKVRGPQWGGGKIYFGSRFNLNDCKAPPSRRGFFYAPDQAASGGVRLLGSKEVGCLLYHHSCRGALRRWEKSVSTVWVGLEPGCNSSTA